VKLLNVLALVKNLTFLNVQQNVSHWNVKYYVPINNAKPKNVQNAKLLVKIWFVLIIAEFLNLNVNLNAKPLNVTGNAEDLLIVQNLVASLFAILQIVPHNKLKDAIIVINRHNLDSKLKYLNKMNKFASTALFLCLLLSVVVCDTNAATTAV